MAAAHQQAELALASRGAEGSRKAGDDLGAGGLGLLPHLRRDQCGVVVVHRIVETALGNAEAPHPGLPSAGARLSEGVVDRVVDPLRSEVSTAPGNSAFWFESMPMASLPASLAACNAPNPVMPVTLSMIAIPGTAQPAPSA